MISFHLIMEAMDSFKHDDESIAVVKAGLNIRPEFWEDFIRITANAEGLSDLLDVPEEKIANWASKINEALSHIDKTNDADSVNHKTQPM